MEENNSIGMYTDLLIIAVVCGGFCYLFIQNAVTKLKIKALQENEINFRKRTILIKHKYSKIMAALQEVLDDIVGINNGVTAIQQSFDDFKNKPQPASGPLTPAQFDDLAAKIKEARQNTEDLAKVISDAVKA